MKSKACASYADTLSKITGAQLAHELIEGSGSTGLSIDEIAAKLELTSPRVNQLICSFPVGTFRHMKVRAGGRSKVTKYVTRENYVEPS